MNRKPRHFHRLSTKFICGITCILLFILTASLLLNSRVAKRYYLQQQIRYVKQAGSRLKDALDEGISPEAAIDTLENGEKVLIVYEKNSSDYDGLSSSLREKFQQKGLGFQKFWLWNQDYLSAVQSGYKFRLYQQDKLNYGILVEYLPVGQNLYAIASIVPNSGDFIQLINHFSVLLYAFSLLAAMVLIGLLVRHITNPLRQIEVFARKISLQEYDSLTIHTHDELQTVADAMNQMCQSIQQYQQLLLAKNEQMKQLLDDVAHDLKTPISLISMYSSGMKDGLDDGTFLDTIIRQNGKMAQLTEQLLSLSRIEKTRQPLTKIRLDTLLEQCVAEHKIFLKDRNLGFHTEIAANVEILGNTELITTLFSNLLSNAVKYGSSGIIDVILYEENQQPYFLISNEFQNSTLDMNQIWEPFYVGEISRNKELSGTGLGLAIVKKIAEQSGYSFRCFIREGRIVFEIIFLK